MTKNRKTNSVLTVSILLGILALITCTTGCTQPGRYQLLENESDLYVLDTATGQAWSRHHETFQSPKYSRNSPGQTGRFKGAVIGSKNCIIDTTTGQVWEHTSDTFRSRKEHLK